MSTILKALTQELNEHIFEAAYEEYIQYTASNYPRIKIVGDELNSYIIHINNNNFIIQATGPSNRNYEIIRQIPIEHPNSILAIMRFLDRKCAWKRSQRRNSIYRGF